MSVLHFAHIFEFLFPVFCIGSLLTDLQYNHPMMIDKTANTINGA